MTLHFSYYITYNCSIMGIDLFKSNLLYEQRPHMVVRFIFTNSRDLIDAKSDNPELLYTFSRSYSVTIFRILFISAQQI